MKQLNSLAISEEIVWNKMCYQCYSLEVVKSETVTLDKNLVRD